MGKGMEASVWTYNKDKQGLQMTDVSNEGYGTLNLKAWWMVTTWYFRGLLRTRRNFWSRNFCLGHGIIKHFFVSLPLYFSPFSYKPLIQKCAITKQITKNTSLYFMQVYILHVTMAECERTIKIIIILISILY